MNTKTPSTAAKEKKVAARKGYYERSTTVLVDKTNWDTFDVYTREGRYLGQVTQLETDGGNAFKAGGRVRTVWFKTDAAGRSYHFYTHRSQVEAIRDLMGR